MFVRASFLYQAMIIIACLCVCRLAFALPASVLDKMTEAQIAPDNISLLAMPVDGSVPIVSHLANTPRVPASTQKLITTAAALDVLGANFVWRTDIYHTGVLAGGVLHGDVVIVGSGDPSMDYQRFENLLATLAKKIKHIKGNIYIDDGKFVGVAYDPYAFDGEGLRAYNAAPNAFLINFGTVEARFVPSGWQGTSGENAVFVPNTTASHATMQLFPKLDGLPSTTAVLASDGCMLPRLTLHPMQVNGAFGVDCGVQSLWQTFGDNRLLAQKAVKRAWQAHDTAFAGRVLIGKPPAKSHLIAVAHGLSKPVSEQIWQINQFSNNVMTEQVALSLPLYANKQYTNKQYASKQYPNGQKVSTYPLAFEFLNRWWQKIGTDAPIMTRTSGLCTDCFIRPKAMADLLGFMYRHPDFETYKASLPVAGVSGTMKSLAKRNPDNLAIGRAWIKTGRLNDVNAMSGYVQGVSGRWYVVVAIINQTGAGYNPKATAVLDEFLAYVANH